MTRIANLRTDLDTASIEIESLSQESSSLALDRRELFERAQDQSEELSLLKHELASLLQKNFRERTLNMEMEKENSMNEVGNAKRQRELAAEDSSLEEIGRQNLMRQEQVTQLEKRLIILKSNLRSESENNQKRARYLDSLYQNIYFAREQREEAVQVLDALRKDLRENQSQFEIDSTYFLDAEEQLQRENEARKEAEKRLYEDEKMLDEKTGRAEELRRELAERHKSLNEAREEKRSLAQDVNDCRRHLESLIELNKKVENITQITWINA